MAEAEFLHLNREQEAPKGHSFGVRGVHPHQRPSTSRDRSDTSSEHQNSSSASQRDGLKPSLYTGADRHNAYVRNTEKLSVADIEASGGGDWMLGHKK